MSNYSFHVFYTHYDASSYVLHPLKNYKKFIDLHFLNNTMKEIWISSFLTFVVLSGDVDLLKEECRMLKEECQTLKEDNRRLSERLQLLQRQRTWWEVNGCSLISCAHRISRRGDPLEYYPPLAAIHAMSRLEKTGHLFHLRSKTLLID